MAAEIVTSVVQRIEIMINLPPIILIPILAATCLVNISCNITTRNTPSGSKETPSGSKWIKLFNGKAINDWTAKINHHIPGKNFGNTFRVEDGIITVRYDHYGEITEQYRPPHYNTPSSKSHLDSKYTNP